MQEGSGTRDLLNEGDNISKPATYSEDGKWMWNDGEWIPSPPSVEPKKINRQLDKQKFFAIAGFFLLVIVVISPEIFERTDDSSNIYALDSDEDGLSDVDELNLGTDYLDSDTDKDGVIDGEEIELGLDPLNQDTDNDGVIDGLDALPRNNFVVQFSWSVRDIEYNEGCHSESSGGGAITYTIWALSNEDNPLSGNYINDKGLRGNIKTTYYGNYDVISHSTIIDLPDEIYANSETITVPIIISALFAGCEEDYDPYPCYKCIDLGPIGEASFYVDLFIHKDVDETYTSEGERTCPHYGERGTPDDCIDDDYNWHGWIGYVSLTTTALLY